MAVPARWRHRGPETEAALLSCPAAKACGVVGALDEERGRIMEAYVVLRNGAARHAATVAALQALVEQAIMPGDDPRMGEFMPAPWRPRIVERRHFVLCRFGAAKGA